MKIVEAIVIIAEREEADLHLQINKWKERVKIAKIKVAIKLRGVKTLIVLRELKNTTKMKDQIQRKKVKAVHQEHLQIINDTKNLFIQSC